MNKKSEKIRFKYINMKKILLLCIITHSLFAEINKSEEYLKKMKSIEFVEDSIIRTNEFFTQLKYAEKGVVDAQIDLGLTLMSENTCSQDYAAAHYWLQCAYTQGSTYAASWLGFIYYWGNGVTQDYAQAFKYYLIADDIPRAQRKLSWFYSAGTVVSQDNKKAYEYLSRAVEGGDASAQYMMGEYYELTNDINRAFELFQLAAEQGNEDAMGRMYGCYLVGMGTPQNLTNALFWLRKYLETADKGTDDTYKEKYGGSDATALYYITMNAIRNIGGPDVESNLFVSKLNYAEKGVPEARFGLWLEFSGDNTYSQNVTASTYWLQCAAKQGHKDAAYILGNLYRDGDSVTQDYAQAYYYYLIAHELPEAQRELAWFYETGTVVSQNQKKAYAYLSSAADRGDSIAQYEVAEYYERTNNIVRAFELYLAASEQEYSLAMDPLAACYLLGRGTDQDFTNALYWLRRYYETDSDTGMVRYTELVKYQHTHTKAYCECLIGDMYMYGYEPVDLRDYTNAFRYYLLAAKAGVGPAQLQLAFLYGKGYGVTQDYTSAFTWFQKAASNEMSYAEYLLGSIYMDGIGTTQDTTKAIQAFKRYIDSGEAKGDQLTNAYSYVGTLSLKQGRILTGLKYLIKGDCKYLDLKKMYIRFGFSGYGVAIAFVLLGIAIYALFNPRQQTSWGILDACNAISLFSYIPSVIVYNSYRFGYRGEWPVLVQAFPYVLLLTFVILAIKKRKWNVAESFSIKTVAFKRALKWAISGIVLCLAIDAIYYIPLYCSDIDTSGNEYVEGIVSGVKNLDGNIFGYIILLIVICVITIFEEILFRGIIYKGLRSKLPVFLAIGITSLLFALMHFDVMRIISLFINSIIFCIAFEKTQSIIPPILIHLGINLLAVSVMFFLL